MSLLDIQAYNQSNNKEMYFQQATESYPPKRTETCLNSLSDIDASVILKIVNVQLFPNYFPRSK